ncbi:MAG: alpha-glucosidase C-terminal domain-containing protein, partial [Chloroflexi bacterium]|nr:alpha-glucosidase C-terminal domain-containing protein [Chloroflexota bacterium]
LALNRGSYQPVNDAPAACFVYVREYLGERRLVAINFSDQLQTLKLDSFAAEGKVLLSTEMDRTGSERLAALSLRPFEGVILDI